MNSIQQEFSEIIGDLIRINKIRIECYYKLTVEDNESSDELKELFEYKAIKVQNNNEELLELLTWNDSLPIPPGRIFLDWNKTKKMLSSENGKAVLSFCEWGEEAALEAYKSALISGALDPIARRVIMDQKYSLQSSHNQIKKYLDLQDLPYYSSNSVTYKSAVY
ncbi:MAG: family four-helix-bundle protein [Ferruginibacter sp.]|nr:family four-helix-bundle protein [Ferruginibacter sp.]